MPSVDAQKVLVKWANRRPHGGTIAPSGDAEAAKGLHYLQTDLPVLRRFAHSGDQPRRAVRCGLLAIRLQADQTG